MEEVKGLCEKQSKLSFDEISEWYNGYINEEGNKIYNPRSVVKALQNGKCISYWTNTGAMDEVKDYLKYNTMDVREDVIKMVSGYDVDIIINEEFRAGQEPPKTKMEIYSAMIILGFLSYYDGYLKIPNKELMREFEKALRDESFGYVSDIIKNSRKMLNVDIAIKQMKEKEYFQKFIKEHENVLAVAICYDSKLKEHSCKIERINLN